MALYCTPQWDTTLLSSIEHQSCTFRLFLHLFHFILFSLLIEKEYIGRLILYPLYEHFIFSQNLAVADILLLTFFFLPVLLVLISRRWIIGETLCFFTFSITSIAGFVDNFTILGISCHRVWVLLCPFRFVSCNIYVRENPSQNSLCMHYNQHFVSGLLHFSLPGSP